MSEVFNRVYDIVRSIPEGKVLTYGLISNLLEGRLSAQGVGWALNALPSSEIRESLRNGQTKSGKVSKVAKAAKAVNDTKGIKDAEDIRGTTGTKGIKRTRDSGAAHSVEGTVEPYTSASVPWHRVINSKGSTSTHKRPDMPPDLQRKLLEEEGVIFDADGKIDLKIYLFDLALE